MWLDLKALRTLTKEGLFRLNSMQLESQSWWDKMDANLYKSLLLAGIIKFWHCWKDRQ